MAESLHRHPAEPSPRSEFYGWHAERGHAPEWTPTGGVECGSCGESYPGVGPESGAEEAEPEPEAG